MRGGATGKQRSQPCRNLLGGHDLIDSLVINRRLRHAVELGFLWILREGYAAGSLDGAAARCTV